MTDEEQEEWTEKYNSMNETDGISMCDNKWVTDDEI